MSVKQGLMALLAEGPMYGAQLRAEFEQRTGGTWPLNVGQVYTTLARLERDGLVGTGDPDRDAAVISYFGDGATSQGDVNEAFVFASSYNAPVVFFCQNNQWAISVPNDKQIPSPLYQRANGFGFPGVRVDGNDVLAVYAVAKTALDNARSGQGPTFIEAFTYRMGAHTTSDDPTKYRVSAEV